MGRLERLFWLLGLVGAFAGGLAICRLYGGRASAPPQPSRILMSVGPEDWSVWNERGRARAHRNDFRGAVEDFDRALELNPRSAMLRNNRGGALLSLGDLRGALKEFTVAVELDPAYAEVHLNRGQTRGDLGDWNGSVEDLEKALSLTDQYWPFRAFTLHRLEIARKHRRDTRVY